MKFFKTLIVSGAVAAPPVGSVAVTPISMIPMSKAPGLPVKVRVAMSNVIQDGAPVADHVRASPSGSTIVPGFTT